MQLARSCVFAFNSNIDVIARPSLAAAERFFGRRIDSGAEMLVDAGTAARIHSAFKWKEMRIGGQAGNMANAAASLGVKCLAHAYNLSPRQKKLFANGVEVVGENTEDESVHYILELKLRNGKRDRLIATQDPVNSNLLISPKFASRSLEFISSDCDRAVVSGFHLLNAKNAEARLEAAANLIRKWRDANTSLRIHFEAGDVSDGKVAESVAKTILPLVDSVGLNKNELLQFAPLLAGSHVEEIVVHTAEYASATSKVKGRDALARALSLGHALAAYRATRGNDATLSDALKWMEKVPKPEFGKDRILVPSIMLKPKCTVGLGDAFTTGFVLAK